MRTRLNNQRGQVAVLFALIFPLFVLLLAFFVNMGVLINQKIRLQNAVDAGVYSAVASMARDMDQVARLNRDIHNVFEGDANAAKYCTQWSESQNYSYIAEKRSFNDKSEAQFKHWEYQNFYHDCYDRIMKINNSAIDQAMERAKNAALMTFYNGVPADVNANPNKLELNGLIPGGRLFPANQNATSKTSCYHKVKDSGGNPFDPYEGYACDFTETTNTPINKPGTVKFAAELTADLGFNNIFPSRFKVSGDHVNSGTGQIQMKVSAAGQPFNGSIEGLRDTYRATLIPLQNFNPSRDELH